MCSELGEVFILLGEHLVDISWDSQVKYFLKHFLLRHFSFPKRTKLE